MIYLFKQGDYGSGSCGAGGKEATLLIYLYKIFFLKLEFKCLVNF